MGCCDGTQTFSANMVSGQGQKVLNHANCEDITEDLLNVFLRLIQCVQVHNLQEIIQETPKAVKDTQVLLETWIAEKQVDPASCKYQSKLPLIQAVVNKIIKYGRC